MQPTIFRTTTFVSFLVVFLFLAQGVSATCTSWSTQADASQVPTWSGMFYDLFSGTSFQPLLKATCPSAGVGTVTIGKEFPKGSVYTYHIGYFWSGSSWKPTSLNGLYGSTKVSNAWYDGLAAANVTISPTADNANYYFVGYTCQYINNSWKCGCRNATCATNHWQLIKFTWKIPPTPPPTGGACSTGGNTVAYPNGCSCGDPSGKDCGSGYCSNGICADRPQGVPQACSTNLQCNGTETCNNGVCGMKGCSAHTDCDSGRLCSSGQCVLGRPCYTDDHCPAYEQCGSQRACVPR